MADLATLAIGGGQLIQGFSASRAAEAEAAQLRERAMATRAEAGAAAREEKRQSRLKQSRAQAVGASSGASLDDPTFVNLMGDIEAEGEYRALSRMYEGETSARSDERLAKARKRQGRAGLFAGGLGAAATVMSGVGSLRTKYSGKSSGRGFGALR